MTSAAPQDRLAQDLLAQDLSTPEAQAQAAGLAARCHVWAQQLLADEPLLQEGARSTVHSQAMDLDAAWNHWLSATQADQPGKRPWHRALLDLVRSPATDLNSATGQALADALLRAQDLTLLAEAVTLPPALARAIQVLGADAEVVLPDHHACIALLETPIKLPPGIGLAALRAPISRLEALLVLQSAVVPRHRESVVHPTIISHDFTYRGLSTDAPPGPSFTEISYLTWRVFDPQHQPMTLAPAAFAGKLDQAWTRNLTITSREAVLKSKTMGELRLSVSRSVRPYDEQANRQELQIEIVANQPVKSVWLIHPREAEQQHIQTGGRTAWEQVFRDYVRAQDGTKAFQFKNAGDGFWILDVIKDYLDVPTAHGFEFLATGHYCVQFEREVLVINDVPA